MNERQRAEQQYADGDLNGSILTLRSYLAEANKDIEAWHRLSLLEEQAGNNEPAGIAHKHCLALAPNLAVAYIYAGYWLAKNDHTEAAASAFSIAFDLQPERFSQQGLNAAAPQTRQRTDLGSKLFTDFLSTQQKKIGHPSSKIANAKWIRIDAAINDLNHENIDIPGFRPELFQINDVRKQAYYEPAEFAWAEEFTQLREMIATELSNAQLDTEFVSQARPYLAKNSIIQGPLANLAGSTNWSAIDLYRDGTPNEDVLFRFPQTLSAINKLPTYGLARTPYEVFFSQLSANHKIAPHYGQSNHSLTVHLTIDTPKHAYLEVNGEKKYWSNNDLIVFDDTFLHSAHNTSKDQRTILLFSIWHPDLDEEDKMAVQRCFKLRGRWLEARQSKIFDALPT